MRDARGISRESRLSYDLGLAEELRWSRELSDALGHWGKGIGPPLDLVGSRARNFLIVNLRAGASLRRLVVQRSWCHSVAIPRVYIFVFASVQSPDFQTSASALSVRC